MDETNQDETLILTNAILWGKVSSKGNIFLYFWIQVAVFQIIKICFKKEVSI